MGNFYSDSSQSFFQLKEVNQERFLCRVKRNSSTNAAHLGKGYAEINQKNCIGAVWTFIRSMCFRILIYHTVN